MRLTLLLCFVCGAATAQVPGARDLSFGTGGRVALNFGGSSSSAGIVRTGDGAYMVAGNRYTGTPWSRIYLARYTAAGVPDPMFATSGIREVAVPGIGLIASDIALTDGGNVLVAGGAIDSVTWIRNFFVLRCTPDGSLDPTFGTGGIARMDIDSNTSGLVFNMDLAPDGKIVLAGREQPVVSTGVVWYAVVVCFNPDGTLDSSFSDDGLWRARDLSPWTISSPGGLVVNPDGKITVGVTWEDAVGRDQGAIRLLPDGTPDPSFGNGGILRANLGVNEDVTDVVIDRAGQVLLCGTDFYFDSSYTVRGQEMFITRYDSTGEVDVSFGGGGQIRYTQGIDATIWPSSMKLDKTGALVVGGSASSPSQPWIGVLLAFNSLGALIPGFSGDGILEEINAATSRVLIDADGKLVTAGSNFSAVGEQDSVVLHRYGGVPVPAAIGDAASRHGGPPQIFPNPSTGRINFGGNLQGYSVYEIRTASGQVVCTGSLAANGPQSVVLPGGRPAGVYTVVLSGNERATALKLLLALAR